MGIVGQSDVVAVPGKGGKIPKRSGQRRRVNKPETPIKNAAAQPAEPLAADPEWHPGALRWYEALSTSGQVVFFQDTDWATAHVWAEILSDQLKSPRRSAQMIQAWSAAASELLTTEGARRRLKIELEVPKGEATNGDVSWLDDARRRGTG